MLTAATSVFIAACYGVPYEGAGGRVVRRVDLPLGPSGEVDVGIAGIEVRCLDAGGAVLEETVTGNEGDFATRAGCTSLSATDVDGDANGGSFAARTVPVDAEWVRIQLEPVP